MTNWKTTATGIAAILAAISHGLIGATTGDFNGVYVDLMAMIVGIQGLVAKDHDVTGGTVKQ